MSKAVYVGAPNSAVRDLPSGYTQVEYIESSGTQYIDTGFKPNQDTRVVIDAQFTAHGTAEFLFGARTSNYKKSFSVLLYNGISSDYGDSTLTYSGLTYTNRYVYDKNKTACTVGGESVTHPANTFQSDFTMYIFACNQGGSVSYQCSARLYSCKVYDNGTLIRDYIPCKNASGVIGLYDQVSGVFYTNAGTGTFTAGAAIVTGSVAHTVKKIYVGIDGIARKVKKAYIGVDGIARLFYSANPFGSYSGTYTVSDVEVDGIACKLYTLTGSGTLVLNDNVQYWMCGGGASGAKAKAGATSSSSFASRSGCGGAGGYIATGALSAGSHVVTIGAGGVQATTAGKGNAGSATKVGSASISGGGASDIYSNVYSNGYSGGGGGFFAHITEYMDGTYGDWDTQTTNGGTGTGNSTLAYPFGLTSLYAHSAGGGGGGMNPSGGRPCRGGAGGSCGSDGSLGDEYASMYPNTSAAGGSGGTRGGGAGGNSGRYTAPTVEAVKGSAATFYGSGGGGGAKYDDSDYSYSGAGGAGYQGVVYLLIPA